MSTTRNESRRTFLNNLGEIAGFGASLNLLSHCAAQDSLPHDIGVQPDFIGRLPSVNDRGTKPAELVEIQTAEAIAAEAPNTGAPLGVAKFLLDVANGVHGEKWVNYAKGWPVRWNPLIVQFFDSTETRPSGDVTPWCAAFANWCVQRTTSKPATKSASSGSFRVFGTPTKEPRPGDLVVFKSADIAQASSGQGHVGFFIQEEANRVLVLGGNQIRQGNHMINETWFAKNGRQLILHSFRTDPRLHP